jgi:GR25 family glycosyltransferase involved in LPS biosynthesis
MKSFVIHLSRIPASLASATATKTALDNFGVSTELWEGCYGIDVEKEFEKTNRKIHPWSFKGPSAAYDLDSKYALKNDRPGIKGCFMSHYTLWKKCIDLNEPIMIWEDDILVRRGYVPVDFDDVLILALGHPAKSERYLHYLETPMLNNPKAEYFQNSSMPGCCGYAIKPHAAKKLVDVYKNSYLPADNAINEYHVKIQIYNCIMGIAMVKKDGKKSLTRTRYWNKLKAQEDQLGNIDYKGTINEE